MKLSEFIVGFLCLWASKVATANATKCYISVDGIALTDHVMGSFSVDDIRSCYEKCATTLGCESINFYMSRKCELNNRTVESTPSKRVINEKAVYFKNPYPDFDECSVENACHANAQCTNTLGSYTCQCKPGYHGDGKNCLAYPKTCNDLKKAFPSSLSGYYIIDSDGQHNGELPYRVYCDMTDKGGVGVTVISHNSENRTQANNCPSDPSCTRHVSYSGASFNQLANLTKISTHCEQYIEYACTGDVAFIEESNAWWVSRDGVKQHYWGGATPGSKKCACGMTNTCHNGKGCNCNNGAGGWRTDSGKLTDKSTLPVRKMIFGDTDSSNEDAYYRLGKLKCY